MTQDIVVYVLIGVALVNVTWQAWKIMFRARDQKVCGGCSGCAISKDRMKHVSH